MKLRHPCRGKLEVNNKVAEPYDPATFGGVEMIEEYNSF
jgi:hypothetical protein